MQEIPQTIGRAQLWHSNAGLRITIPAQRRWDVILAKPLLVAFMLWGMHVIFRDSPGLMAIISVTAAAVVAKQALWSLVGEEVITVSKHTLTVRFDLGGFRFQHNYSLDRVSELRFMRWTSVQQLRDGDDAERIGFISFDYDGHPMPSEEAFQIVSRIFHFDYNPRRPRFGRGLSEPEVQQIITAIESGAGSSLSTNRDMARAAAGA